MAEAIDIKGLDKGLLLQTLFNHSKTQGHSFMSAMASGDWRHAAPLTLEEATNYAEHFGDRVIDYLRGRVMKVSIGGDTLDPRLYDRDNGPGAAAKAINKIRPKEEK